MKGRMGCTLWNVIEIHESGRISRNLQAAVQGQGADTTMAVPNMLEIVPRGINKWVGMQHLLEDLQIDSDGLMSCGDGINDLQLVTNSGIGIAMGNAVPAVSPKALSLSRPYPSDYVHCLQIFNKYWCWRVFYCFRLESI